MESCVAVCTIDSDNISLPSDKIVLKGTCKTENLGVESIVKGIIKDPKIRFLVLCGKELVPRYAGYAIKCLWENGVVDNGKIVGAKGLMPFIKNLSTEEIEHFRKQVEIIDAIGQENPAELEGIIDSCNERNPGIFGAPAPKGIEVPEIQADYDPDSGWTADEKNDENWFVIGIDRDRGLLFVEHHIGYGENMKKCCRITGSTVESVIVTIVRLGKVTKLYHAAYLGKELQKAEIAMKKGIKYNQELEFEV